MKTLAKYHACNHYVIGPGKLPGLSERETDPKSERGGL